MSQSAIRDNLHTLRSHLEARKQPRELVDTIDAVGLAGRAIARHVRRARIDDVLGEAGATNVQGEAQQKLDILADDLLLHCLKATPSVAVYASEEREEPVVIRPRSGGGELCVLADPLDGSSNIDVAVSVGTIFSVLRNDQPDGETAAAVLQPGSRQLAAGYILYGSSVVMVLALDDGVDMFVLDPDLGDFVLVKEQVRIPAEKKIYSINEAYVNGFEAGLRAYLAWAHESGYAARYIGSMVADVHRTLLKGGVFIYPATDKAPEGKLRLLYEGSPMAFIVERAGGAAAAASGRILDVAPNALHQRTPVILGSSQEVDQVTRRLA
jgi:fructose-1,6-bisphosphatase I